MQGGQLYNVLTKYSTHAFVAHLTKKVIGLRFFALLSKYMNTTGRLQSGSLSTSSTTKWDYQVPFNYTSKSMVADFKCVNTREEACLFSKLDPE